MTATPPFTPDQLDAIHQIVRRAIDSRLAPQQLELKRPKSHHTAKEIRWLIVEHVEEFSQWVGKGDFTISVLRLFLSRKTVMREGDTEISNPSHSRNTMWDKQVSQALRKWPSCPIKPAAIAGRYRIDESAVLALRTHI